jgi:hypothetical protein
MVTNGTIPSDGGQAIADETMLYGNDANMRAEGVSVENVKGTLEIIDRKAQAQNQERARKQQQGPQPKPNRSQLYQFYEASKLSRPRISAPTAPVRRGVRTLGGGNFLAPAGNSTQTAGMIPIVTGRGGESSSSSSSFSSSNQPYVPMIRQDDEESEFDINDFLGGDVQMEGEGQQ